MLLGNIIFSLSRDRFSGHWESLKTNGVTRILHSAENMMADTKCVHVTLGGKRTLGTLGGKRTLGLPWGRPVTKARTSQFANWAQLGPRTGPARELGPVRQPSLRTGRSSRTGPSSRTGVDSEAELGGEFTFP